MAATNTNADTAAAAGDIEKAGPEVRVHDGESQTQQERTFKQKFRALIWDSLDKSPEERRFIAKIDWWILSYCCVAYFVKYLDQTNVSFSLFRFTSSCLFVAVTSLLDL